MYEYITGKYIGFNKDYIILENNNIGYRIFTSGATMAELPGKDEEVTLFLEQIVREAFIGLYGFTTQEELNMFKLLISINGVGAKAALSLLSISKVNNLKYAIITGDDKLICRAPGIGKKTAGRVILELKDKLKKENMVVSKSVLEDNNIDSDYIESNNILEAREALISLGYTEKEADKALEKADKTLTVEEIIKVSLKILMG